MIYLCYIIVTGGDCIYELIFTVLSIVISYNVISYCYVSKKAKYIESIQSNSLYSRKILNLKILQTYFNNVKEKLKNYNYPYKLNFRRYIFIKYFLSLVFLILSYTVYSNIIISIIYYSLIYSLPDLLIKVFIKNEGTKIYTELYTLTQNIILSLTVKLTLHKAFKLSINNICYTRFKIEFEKFINDYEISNLNIQKAFTVFSKKFNSYYLDMFLSALIQGEKEGNVIENLENYMSSLDAIYYKKLKKSMMKRAMCVAVATIITLGNTLMIVLYPMFTQVTKELNLIFK